MPGSNPLPNAIQLLFRQVGEYIFGGRPCQPQRACVLILHASQGPANHFARVTVAAGLQSLSQICLQLIAWVGQAGNHYPFMDCEGF
jgi:hypothetical protein